MANEFSDSLSKKSKELNQKTSEADFRDRSRKQLSVPVRCAMFSYLQETT